MNLHTDPARRYGATAITLHWGLALMILASAAVGAYMADLPLSPQRLKLFNWHKWAGITILSLSLVRLAWRLAHRPPPPLPAPRWQQRAATLAHALMYALCIAVPLAGWAYSSATGFPVVVFGVLPLPDFVPVDRGLAARLEDLHGALAWSLVATAALHALAALKHQFIDHDGLLHRMGLGRAAP